MAIPSRIYLTGFMGSGKSSVGPRVAKRLGYGSMDLDREIKLRFGMSIPAIFDVMGEKEFRRVEQELLETASRREQIVVSLGGGAVMNPAILGCCLATGVLVYLKGNADFLYDRLRRSTGYRPLLLDENGTRMEGAKLKARIAHLLQDRESTYEQAHVTVEIDGRKKEEVASSIIERISGNERISD